MLNLDITCMQYINIDIKKYVYMLYIEIHTQQLCYASSRIHTSVVDFHVPVPKRLPPVIWVGFFVLWYFNAFPALL